VSIIYFILFAKVFNGTSRNLMRRGNFEML